MTPQYGIVLNLLKQTESAAADQALGAALLAEEGDLGPRLADVLLARGSDEAMVYLVRAVHRLDKAHRQRLVDLCPKISGALRIVSRDPDPQSRENVLDLILAAQHPALAYILSYMLHDEAPSLRARAAGVFKSMAACLLARLEPEAGRENGGRDTGRARELDSFFSVLEKVLDNFPNHLRTEVVEAGMYFGPMLPDRLWARFTEDRSRIGRAAVEILRRESNPRFAGFAFRALTSRTLGKDVVRIVSGYNRESFLRWLAFGWYRFDANVRRNLLRITRPFPWLSGGLQHVVELPGEVQIRFIDILLLTSIGAAEKLEILCGLLTAQDPVVQEHVVSVVIQADLPGGADLLQRAVAMEKTSRFSARAARMARRHLRQSVPKDAAEATPDRPGPIGTEPGIEQHFDQFWLAYDHLDGSTSQAAIERLVRLEENFVGRLRGKMASADPAERTRAISVARRARVAAQLSDEIFIRCNDIHPATRSAAVGALADIDGPLAEQRLVEALDDEDARVQANAIEALEARDCPDLEEHIERKLDSPNNRIRANAIKAILKPRYLLAIRALAVMLEHPDPAFRRSALWAVVKTTPLNLGAKVVQLAKDDPDGDVRGMAHRAVEALLRYWKRSKSPADAAGAVKGNA